jgi:hypothetical protein
MRAPWLKNLEAKKTANQTLAIVLAALQVTKFPVEALEGWLNSSLLLVRYYCKHKLRSLTWGMLLLHASMWAERVGGQGEDHLPFMMIHHHAKEVSKFPADVL